MDIDFNNLSETDLKKYCIIHQIVNYNTNDKIILTKICQHHHDKLIHHDFENEYIYFNINYDEKDSAKYLGAKFDFKKKLWYANELSTYFKLIEKFKIYKPIKNIMFEDRTFGGNLLFVDLIPKTSWYKNLRSHIGRSNWNRLRRYVYARVNHICECCGYDAFINKKSLECHERWKYDMETNTQTLVRFVALCRKCHQSTHIGFAKIRGKGKEAKEHLKTIRKFNDLECDEHIKNAFDIWKKRSSIKWKIDMSLLTKNEIKHQN